MLVPIDKYRTVTGDTESSDSEIETALRYAQSRVEGYTERQLESQEHIERHYFVGPEPLLIKQWPISDIASIDKDGSVIDPAAMTLDRGRGVLHHNNKLTWGKEIIITYTAGYGPCPADIESLIVELAKSRLTGALNITGPQSAQAIKRETVYGVSAVDYDTSAQSSARIEFYPELGSYVRILDRYCRASELPVC